jgi:hypothetical protein
MYKASRAPSGAVFDHSFVLNTIILPQPLSPSIQYGPHQQFMEAARDHRPCLQGLCTQGFATAAFGVMAIAMVRERGKSVGSDEVGASVFYSISRHISPSYHWPYLCTIGIPLSYEVVCCKLSKSVPFAVTVWYRFIVKSRCLTLAASVPLSRHGDF